MTSRTSPPTAKRWRATPNWEKGLSAAGLRQSCRHLSRSGGLERVLRPERAGHRHGLQQRGAVADARRELLKAQAYLALAPHDDKSQHNMSLLRQRLAQRPQPQAGRRGQYAAGAAWSEVAVKPQGERWLIDFSGYAMPQMGLYYGPNMGDFTAELPIEHGKAVYHQHDSESAQVCDVTLEFGEQALEMHTRGDCGFGHNVRAEGRFVRVDDPPRQPGRER
ncbi:hypothetical protein M8494_00490 [Serratia ureilytica]